MNRAMPGVFEGEFAFRQYALQITAKAWLHMVERVKLAKQAACNANSQVQGSMDPMMVIRNDEYE